MKRSMIAVAAALVMMTGAAPAHAGYDTTFARQLGSVLGSEKDCGLTYDQGAIQKYITEHVADGDMDFTHWLRVFTYMESPHAYPDRETADSLLAHCTQIRRVAKQLGFTKQGEGK